MELIVLDILTFQLMILIVITMDRVCTKWLATPLGAGLLYVNKNKTHKIWPLLANGNTNKSDIKRLNHIGTHPIHLILLFQIIIDYIKMDWNGKKGK